MDKKNWIIICIVLILALAGLVVFLTLKNNTNLGYIDACDSHKGYATQTTSECLCPTTTINSLGYIEAIWVSETDGWHCYYTAGI